MISPRLGLFIAQWFGVGKMPFASGTWGSLAALPLVVGGDYLGLPIRLKILLLTLLFIVGVWTSSLGEKALGEKDPSSIVIDEVVGQGLALLPVCYLTSFQGDFYYLWIILGFLLFRFFDILKPWPVSWADQHLKGGFGIMMDDVIAGEISAMLLILGHFFVITITSPSL
jgi:phosphatidylglycerophosphatase A